MRWIKLIAWTLILSGCATLPHNKQITWSQRKKQLGTVRAWTSRGTLALRENRQGFSGHFYWQKKPNRYTLVLTGPFGSHSMRLQGNARGVTLTTLDGTTQAPSAQALVKAHTGLDLPVANLIYWVRGLPVPNMPAKLQRDRYHHLRTLKQRGWEVQYLDYTAVNHVDLPRRLFIHRAGLELQLLIHEWELPTHA